MTIKNVQLRHTLIYGAIIGGTITLYELILYVFGMTNNKTLENLSLFFYVLGIFLSVRKFRDMHTGGIINFKKAFTIGFLTCLFIAVIGSIYAYFQFKYLSPHLLDEIIELSQERLLSKGIPDSQIELQTAIMEQFLKPGSVAVISLFSSLFWGSVMSLIVAALLKREENPLLKSD